MRTLKRAFAFAMAAAMLLTGMGLAEIAPQEPIAAAEVVEPVAEAVIDEEPVEEEAIEEPDEEEPDEEEPVQPPVEAEPTAEPVEEVVEEPGAEQPEEPSERPEAQPEEPPIVEIVEELPEASEEQPEVLEELPEASEDEWSMLLEEGAEGLNLSASASSEFVIDENGVLTKYNGTSHYVVIPEGVTAIGEKAFYDDNWSSMDTSDKLFSVKIPGSVKYIGNNAFGHCYRLEDVTIEYGVESIDKEAFYYSGLKKISLPDSITSIGASAFSRCYNLREVNLSKNLTTIGDYAFEDCALTSLTMPDSVTHVGKWAFIRCNFTSMRLSENLTTIEPSTFAYCPLTTVELPSSLTRLEYAAFGTCQSLTSVTIPGTLKYIGPSAFYKCIDLENLEIEDGVEYIGEAAFYGCECIEWLEIPGSVKEIELEAFQSCSIYDLTINEGVESIGDNAFAGNCIDEISIPKSVKYLGVGAFEDCDLTRVYIAGKKLEIDNRAFANCNIRYAVLYEGVKSLGKAVFSGSRSCQIHLPKSLTDISSNAFKNFTGVLVVKSGSYAQRFAKSHGLSYRVANIGKIGTIHFRGGDYLEYIPIDGYKLSWKAVSGAKYYKIIWSSDYDDGTLYGKGTLKVTKNLCYITCAEPKVNFYIWVGAYSKDDLLLAEDSIELCTWDIDLPTRIRLNRKKLTLGVGDYYVFTPKLIPSHSDEWWFYTSSKPKVANFEGSDDPDIEDDWDVLTAKAPGKTKITIETINGKRDTCEVTVKKAPIEGAVSVSPPTLTLAEGQSASLSVKYKKGFGGRYAWNVEPGTGDATINDSGELVAISAGTVKVYAEMYNGVRAICDVTIEPAPEEIGLNDSEFVLGKGESFTLKPTAKSGDAEVTKATFTYASSNKAAVFVDRKGKITAKKITKKPVTITVTAYNYEEGKPELRTECTVTVKAAPTKVTIANKVKTLGVGEDWTLGATVSAKNRKGKVVDCAGAVTFKSSKSSVLYVNKYTGELTPKKPGTAKITATAYNKKRASVTITVKKAPESIRLQKSQKALEEGAAIGPYGAREEVKLSVLCSPSNSFGNASWTSSDESIATVKNGVVTVGDTPGTATITASVYNKANPETPLKASCKIEVKAAPTAENTHLVPKKEQIGVGESVATELVFTDAAGAVKSYKSSNKKVATVSTKGVIKGVKTGKVTITATMYNDAEISKEIEVVKAPKTLAITNLPEGKTLTVGEDKTGVVKIFTSSSTKKASFNGGVLTAKAVGTTKITCKTYNGKASKTVTIRIVAATEP